jgi:hypothetical protein
MAKKTDRNPIAATFARRTGAYAWKATNKRKEKSRKACRGRHRDD